MSEYNTEGWENSEFPIVCGTCLGDNPYLRMIKRPFGKACKMCQRPCTYFRWSPGARMRQKTTEICNSCARIKNVCQTCMLDLDLKVPIQVRDVALGIEDTMAKQDASREVSVFKLEKEMNDANSLGGKIETTGKELLERLAQPVPHFTELLPKICYQFIKGECLKGDKCELRHVLPSEEKLKEMKEREQKRRAEKFAKEHPDLVPLVAPEDLNIKTLFLLGITSDITDQDIKAYFEHFGNVKSVILVKSSQAAFVNFSHRSGAENAATVAHNNCYINNHFIKIQWAKPKRANDSTTEGNEKKKMALMDPVGTVKYPSMRPSQLGSISRD